LINKDFFSIRQSIELITLNTGGRPVSKLLAKFNIQILGVYLLFSLLVDV